MAIFDDLKKYKSYKKHSGTYGIEIETEALDGYDVPEFKYWKHDEDHSLRNFGIEYMLKSPLIWKHEVVDALSEFEQKTAHIEFDRNSNSTSVHVHMNMLNETWLTLANVFTIYALLENLLIRWSGPTRRSNLFCLPICDAEQQYQDIITILKGIKEGKFQRIWDFSEKSNKYAALNFIPLQTLGSIEFRSFRGDPCQKAITRWINILNCILVYSRLTTPDQIITEYRQDASQLLKDIFGTEITLDLLHEASKQGDTPMEIISQNLWYAASIALWNKDWTNFGVFEEKTPVKFAGPSFEKYVVDMFGNPPQMLSSSDLSIAQIMYENHTKIQSTKLSDYDIFNTPSSSLFEESIPLEYETDEDE